MSSTSFLMQSLMQELDHLKTESETKVLFTEDSKKKSNNHHELVGINSAITCIKDFLVKESIKEQNIPENSFSDLWNKNSEVKDQLFNLTNYFYPATNPNIKNMSFITLINRAIGELECISRILASENRSDINSYAIQFCDKCRETTYQRINKTTTNCVVCNKRLKLKE